MDTDDHAPARSRIRVRRGAIGVLERDARLLLIRRAAGLARGGLWCFPGGHVERGETSRRAIRRELAEELGIRAIPEERVGAIRVPDPGYILAVWRMTYAGDPITPADHEVAEIGWFTPSEIRAMEDGIASNAGVLTMLGV